MVIRLLMAVLLVVIVLGILVVRLSETRLKRPSRFPVACFAAERSSTEKEGKIE